MLYSEDRKYVFVAVPKTGTTAIQDRLREIDPDIKHNQVRDACGDWVKIATHATAAQIRAVMGARADDFTFIAFLRDPRDILVSKYHFYRSGRAAHKHGLFQTERLKHRIPNLGLTLRVLSAQLLPLSLWARLYPLRSSVSFVTDDESDKLMVDQLGTTERLQEDVMRIFSAFGYTPEELQLRIANRTNYNRAQNPKIAAIAERRLSEDCALYDRLRAE